MPHQWARPIYERCTKANIIKAWSTNRCSECDTEGRCPQWTTPRELTQWPRQYQMDHITIGANCILIENINVIIGVANIAMYQAKQISYESTVCRENE